MWCSGTTTFCCIPSLLRSSINHDHCLYPASPCLLVPLNGQFEFYESWCNMCWYLCGLCSPSGPVERSGLMLLASLWFTDFRWLNLFLSCTFYHSVCFSLLLLLPFSLCLITCSHFASCFKNIFYAADFVVMWCWWCDILNIISKLSYIYSHFVSIKQLLQVCMCMLNSKNETNYGADNIYITH